MSLVDSRERGFTLIEVLIVVVIIGVLASLIIPRLSGSQEKAIAAEGNRMISALIRAQQRRIDSGDSPVLADSLAATDWNTLGLQEPGGGKFTYGCADTSCTATRSAGNTIAMDWTANGWSCSGIYTDAVNGGCKV